MARGYIVSFELINQLSDRTIDALVAARHSFGGGPVLRLKGWVNKVAEVTSGGVKEGRCDLTIVSNARAGTRTLVLKKSDASGRLRKLPDGREDRAYKYTDISGAVPVEWSTT